MQNFNFSLEERIIIAKSIKFFAIIIGVLFYYLKTYDIKRLTLMLFVGYLGAEVISIIETLSTSNLPLDLSMIFSSGVRNSGGFLFVFIMFIFDKKAHNKKYYYAILSSIIGMLVIGKWHCLISADGCYGTATNSMLAMKMYGLKPTTQSVHPVPIYDSVLGIISLLILFYSQRKLDFIKLTILGAFLFSFQGFIMEYLRINTKIFIGLTINQIAYSLIILIIPFVYCYKIHQSKKSFQDSNL